jgi:tRNA nucleotidyltransferase (CCA-adding enzyme)
MDAPADNAMMPVVPIERRVKFVPSTSSTTTSCASDDATTTNSTNDTDFYNEVLIFPLDENEEQLFNAIQNATKAWVDGKIQLRRQQQQQEEESTTTATTTSMANATTRLPIPIEVRVAGGWVRDKILGLQTHDVDIALDTCTGVEFATLLKSYIEEEQQQQQNNEQDHEDDMETDDETYRISTNNVHNNKTHSKKTKRTNTNTNTNTTKTTAAKAVGKIGVIAANPAQSKHLETATMRVFGLEVDFNNLRHETYADDSRIPEIGIGTPLEDAYRRDFTMNALFFNLRTGMVEDWTRRGLLDLLQTKAVETPLEAYKTFHDDPLRVLRAVRFAVRYQMVLSDDLIQAAKHSQIHMELQKKVSRERVGKELEGMLSGKHSRPIQALDLISQMHLIGSVFCLPQSSSTMPISGTIGQTYLYQIPYNTVATASAIDIDDADSEDSLSKLRAIAWEEGRECLHLIPSIMDALQINYHRHGDGISSLAADPNNSNNKCLTAGPNVMNTTTTTPVDKRLVYLATLLLPYQNLQYMEKPTKNKPIIEYMMRESIKFKSRDVTSMVTIMQGLDDMVQLLQSRPPDVVSALIANTKLTTTRLQCGLILRTTKDMWVTTLIVATISLIRQRRVVETSASISDSDTTTTVTTSTLDERETPKWWCQRAVEWYRTIVNDMNLDGSWTNKPLMNGQELIQFLGLAKGPDVGMYTQEQIRWMLMNPNGTIGHLRVHLKSYQTEQRTKAEAGAVPEIQNHSKSTSF